MEIVLTSLGRRFNRDWIFRDVNYTFIQGNSYAILGKNGAGKSTLLQVIAGSLTPSEGKVSYTHNTKEVEEDSVYNYLSIAAPYLELIEEFTLSEMIDFHFKFKSFHSNLNKDKVIEILDFSKSKNKEIKYYSSGMKQRTKLALAVCSETPVLMLDEPTSNLDLQGIEWYQELVQKYTADRLVMICSNQEHEYGFCKESIQLADYK